MAFEPFDDDFIFDESILTEEFPNYLMPGVKKWVFDTLRNHSMFNGVIGRGQVTSTFIHPLNKALRKNIRSNDSYFFIDISSKVVTFRNVLSYMLQKVASNDERRELEKILREGGSAYAISSSKGVEVKGIKTSDGEPIFEKSSYDSKLSYRVPPVVKKQAVNIIANEQLINEAWEFYYGIKPDDEKTVVRCADAISGLLRDEFFTDEKRPVLGTMLNKITKNPSKYKFPANTIYDIEDMVNFMKQFSKIRGNHQKGTGRKPTHIEAGFVLHFTVMLFQLFRIDKP